MTASVGFDIYAKDRASSVIKGVGDAAEKSHSKFARFGQGMKTVAKVGMLGLAGGAAVAGVAMFKMAKAAAEDEVGQKRLALALKNNAGATKGQVAATENWISKQGVALGVTDDELRPALGRLVAATHDVGKAQKLASLAMDVSAGSGKSLDAVSTALAKAQNGNTAGLGRLGIATKDAAGHTLSLKQITQNLADTYGGQATAKANTFQGKMDRLKLVFNETKESIGAKLLPVLTSMGTWFLDKGVPAISKVWSWLSEKLGPVFRTVGNFISQQVVPAVQKMIGQFQGATGKTGGLSKAFQDLKPFLSLVGHIFTNVLGPALKWIASTIIPIVITQFRATAKVLGVVGQAGLWLWNKALAPAFRFIVQGIGTQIQMWGKMLQTLGHVPGFGWAREAGDKMVGAGQKAVAFADKIRAIPTSHNTRATFDGDGAANAAGRLKSIYAGIPRSIVTQAITNHVDKFEHATGGRASGGSVSAGRTYKVGENGPEYLTMPADGYVTPNHALNRGARGGSGGGGDTIVHLTINGALDPLAVGKQVQQALLKLKRGNGGASLGLA